MSVDAKTTSKASAILPRIKKHLALSTSSNANEAAAALKKAQELMEEYGLDPAFMNTLDISDTEVRSRSGDKPPKYEACLVGAIARAFGCKLVYRSRWVTFDGREYYQHRWAFVGAEHRIQIAGYMAVVLLRKLAAARSEYLKTLHRCRRNLKVQRADEHCLGWVSVVIMKLNAIAVSDKEEAALQEYLKRYGQLDKLDMVERNSPRRFEARDFHSGRRAADGVQLHHGVSGANGAPALIGMASG